MKKTLLLLLLLLNTLSCAGAGLLSGEGSDEYLNKTFVEKNTADISHLSEVSSALALYMGYQAALVAGDADSAANLANQFVKRSPGVVSVYIDLITISIYLKNYDRAEELIWEVRKTDPDNIDALTSSANIHMVKGKAAQAADELEKAIRLDPKRENLYLVLSNLYLQDSKPDRAVETLKKLLAVNPENFAANITLAKLYENMNFNKEAAELYEKAFREREEDEILVSLDRIYEKIGDRAKAVSALEKFIENNSDYPKVRERLAILYLEDGRYDNSLDQFDSLIGKFPENLDLKFKASYVALQADYHERSKAYLNEILEKEPDNQKAFYFMGLLYKDMKDCQKAIPYFLRITSAEYSKSAGLNLALCYEKTGEREKAFTLLTDMWAREKDEETAYFLGIFYKNRKQYDSALGVVLEFLGTAKPKDHSMLILLGEIYLKKGEFRKGIGVVEEALKGNPDSAEMLNFVGYSYAERGMQLDKAETMLRKANELKPDDPYIMDSVAWLYFMKKEYKKAYEWQKKAVDKLKDEGTILEHMGDILMALGRKKEAKTYYLEAVKHDPDNPEAIRKKLEGLKNF